MATIFCTRCGKYLYPADKVTLPGGDSVHHACKEQKK